MGNLKHNDIHITAGGTTMVTFNSPNNADIAVSKVLVEAEFYTGQVASWGSENNYPQNHLKKVRRSEASVSALRVLRNAHYGSGFVLVEEKQDEKGKRLVQQKSIKAF